MLSHGLHNRPQRGTVHQLSVILALRKVLCGSYIVCQADKHVDSLHNAMQEAKSMNKRSISLTFMLNLVKHLRILNKMLIIARISETIFVYNDTNNISAFAQTCSSFLDLICINVFLQMKTTIWRNGIQCFKKYHFHASLCAYIVNVSLCMIIRSNFITALISSSRAPSVRNIMT